MAAAGDVRAAMAMMAKASVEPIRRSGLVEAVYARIRADIMSVKIPPATRISVDQLARELGVSQTPIREALGMLEASGLVIRQHLIGYCTGPKLNRAQIDQLYEIRLMLEPAAARLAAQKMSDAALAELAALEHRMDPDPADASRTAYERYADDDAEFHDRIAQGSGNRLIAESLARLHAHLHIFRLRHDGDVTRDTFEEHRQILRALQARSPRAAEKAMREHFQRSYRRLLRLLER
ncbi:MAG: GntR family transcriptional regulator [Lautropia sp.]